MNKLWTYRFELTIAFSGALLLVNLLLPDFLHDGINGCLLLLFLVSIILLKLQTIDDHMKKKLHKGGL